MVFSSSPRFRRARGGTALVTGASSGIGREFAEQLAARGCDLVLVSRSRDRLEETAQILRERHGVAIEVVAADLSTDEGTAAVSQRLAATHEPIDILVNNAGSGLHSSLIAEDISDHEYAFDLMVRAVFRLGNVAGRHMNQRGKGLIINIASVASYINMGNYSAIKSWVRRWSGSLNNDLRGTGVQVMTLNPGWVRTEFHQRSGTRTSNIPDFLWLDVQDVVAACLRDVDAGRSFSVPSLRFKALRTLAHHGPLFAVDAVARQINQGRRR